MYLWSVALKFYKGTALNDDYLREGHACLIITDKPRSSMVLVSCGYGWFLVALFYYKFEI